MAGWSIKGELPDLPKFVIIGAPHTSNWDFLIAMIVLGALGIRAQWLAKHTIFRWPLGPVMRALGGVPVERSKHHGIVSYAIDLFKSSEQLVVGITPEGTRKRVTQWRTGFYHIAVGAGVPIVPGYFDYPHRLVGFGEPFWPGDDMAKDIKSLQSFYAVFADSGRRPHHY